MDIKNINFIKIENHENGLIEGYASVFDVIDQLTKSLNKV